jgi:hypothetical protein
VKLSNSNRIIEANIPAGIKAPSTISALWRWRNTGNKPIKTSTSNNKQHTPVIQGTRQQKNFYFFWKIPTCSSKMMV